MTVPSNRLSNPFSTGGGGHNFEIHVQAAYVVLMLTGGFAPCLRDWPITKIKLQGKYADFCTDDFVAFTSEPGGGREGKLLAQIKHIAAITEGDSTFEEVMHAAWVDFNNAGFFKPGTDAIALITGPLSAVDTENARTLLEWARTVEDAKEFVEKVGLARFSSDAKRNKLQAFRVQLNKAKGSPLTDDELWKFMKSFHLLGYDFDVENGVVVSLLRSVIGRNVPAPLHSVWDKVVNHVLYVNQNAGTITKETLPKEILEAFTEQTRQTIPAALAPSKLTVYKGSPAVSHTPNDLTMALMVGEWNDTSAGDIRAIEGLTNSTYSDWIAKIREILQQPDPPLSFRNGQWEVIDRLELWKVLASRAFDEHLDRFKTMAVTVLRERNPELELEPEQRYEALVHGKVLEHSRQIRKGIASTLAILGNYQTLFTSCSSGKVESTVGFSVRELFQGANWELWLSLDDVLPLLAEAAPGEFLDAVEHGLRSSPRPFDQLFAQERSGIFGRTCLSGLLWALESLAWEPPLLVRVVDILGELASIDPGGNWANRPSNSLTTILLPWMPQTLAPVSVRKTAVEVLLSDCPGVAWMVLLTLLPNGAQSSSGSHKPSWRQSVPENRQDGVTHAEYWEQIEYYSTMAVERAKTDFARLASLLDHVADLPHEPRVALLEHLKSEAIINLDEDTRTTLWNALERVLSHHGCYSDSNWALPLSEMAAIATAADAIAPKSPIRRFQRLFSDREFELLDEDGQVLEQLGSLEKKRQAVVEDILRRDGYDSVIELARRVDSPQMVGAALAELDSELNDSRIVPSLLLNDEKALFLVAEGYVCGRFRQREWSWVDHFDTRSWTPDQKGQFLAHLPFMPETWKRVSQLLADNEAPYWTRTPAYPFGSETDLTPGIKRLIEFDRPNAAIRCIRLLLHKNKPLDMETAIAALGAVSESSSEPIPIDAHSITFIISKLQEDKDVQTDDLIRIEWKFLSLLVRGRRTRPLTLERGLAEDASFFCEAIRAVYRGKIEGADVSEPSEAAKERASNVYHLLFYWKYPPGLRDHGSFDGYHFAAWLSAVRNECEESGHLDVALEQVGHVLRYCPEDPDGLWLPRPVAEALNAPDAEPMRDGYRTELFNSRGVHRFSAGDDEKKLAEKYEQYAQAVEEYHRLATTLRELADKYRRDAARMAEGDLD
jgi:hypothetical protein